MTEHRHERDAFIAAASEFCELYENAEKHGHKRFLVGLAHVLPRLQAAAVELPYPDDADEIPDDDPDVDLTTAEMQSVAFPGHILDGIDSAPIRDDLRGPPDEPVEVLLYDDLCDIYRDLKNGFRILDAGRPEAEAVFYWRLNFWSHWGYSNAEALRVVHVYVALFPAG